MKGRTAALVVPAAAAVWAAWMAWVAFQRSGDDRAGAPLVEPPDVLRNNAAAIARIEDPRRTRDFTFASVAQGLAAEGVFLERPGDLRLVSQNTGGEVSQSVLHARILGGTQTLTRAAAPEVRVSAGAVHYPRFFEEGLDLEYRYDGKDVEEIFHASPELRRSLAAQGAGLSIVCRLNGLSPEQGALLLDGDGAPWIPGADQPELRTSDRVELAVRQHRYLLPGAIAFDHPQKTSRLARTFRFTPEGLEIAVDVPAALIAASETALAIDPSIIDQGRNLRVFTWNERNLVVDSAGRFHVAYMGVVNNQWKALYTSGNAAGWSTPSAIEPSYGPGETTHYAPALAIDGADTLHAIWADYGQVDADPLRKGSYVGFGHRLRYATCPNRCAARTWLPAGTSSKLLAPTASAHQYAYHLAVDQNDVVHAVWYERSPNRLRYFQIGPSGATEKQAPGTSFESAQVVVDGTNTVHFLGANRYGDLSLHHFTFDRNQDVWRALPSIEIRRPPNTGNGGRQRQYMASAAVDANDNVHVAIQLYSDFDVNPTHSVGYARWDRQTSTWNDVGTISEPDRANQAHEQYPSLTADDNGTVHALWLREVNPQPYVLYARKTASCLGAIPNQNCTWTAWSAPIQLVRTIDRQGPPQVRPRLSWPRGPNASVPPGIIEAVLVEADSTLMFLSTGQPVTTPEPAAPPDHSYVSDTTPRFRWNRLASDIGASSGVSYDLQIARTPAFETAETTTVDAGSATSFTLPGASAIANGEFRYWRVRGRTATGAGPFGPIWELGVDTSSPAAFRLTAPAHQSDPQTRTPTFQWEAAQD